MTTLPTAANADDVERRIRAALELTGEDARRITVSIHGTRAVLHGTVHTWADHLEAELAALGTPGVWSVDNQLSLLARTTVHREP